jgi:hypothetical protein
MGAVAKSYMRKGFLIDAEMRKYLVINEEAVSLTMILQPLPSGFSHILGIFTFFFIRVSNDSSNWLEKFS